MAIRQLARSLGFLFIRVKRPVLEELHNLARQEQRTYEAVAADLLSAAIDLRKQAELRLDLWQHLTPREQEVAALVCLEYTNAQIADRLSISKTTVSTHIRNILIKFGLHSKVELRQLYADLDFSGWD